MKAKKYKQFFAYVKGGHVTLRPLVRMATGVISKTCGQRKAVLAKTCRAYF